MDFSKIASNYDGDTNNDRLKKLLGKNFDTFVTSKVEWLLRKKLSSTSNSVWLDFGCGTGELLQALSSLATFGNYEKWGYDESSEMIKEAKKRNFKNNHESLINFTSDKDLINKHKFDIISVVNVLHHIPITDRLNTLNYLYSLLRPNGQLIIIEHNPHNLITRFFFRRAPMDADAVLVQPAEISEILRRIGFKCIKISFLLFLPPRNRFLRYFDRYLENIPLGGQFGIISNKLT